MGLLEPITHKEEIENLLNEAQTKYDTALNNFNKQKEKTADCLEELGKVKIKAWSEGMDSFVTNFSAFNNIEIIKTVDTNVSFIGSSEEPQQKLKVLHNKKLKETEFIKNSTKTLLRISQMSCITKIYHPEERHWLRSRGRMNLLLNMLMGSRSSR